MAPTTQHNLEALPPDGMEVVQPGLEPVASQGDFRYSQDKYVPPPAQTICGVRKTIFWPVIAAALVVVAVGMAVGLGVGLSQARNSAPTVTVVSNSAGDVGSVMPSMTVPSNTPFASETPSSTTRPLPPGETRAPEGVCPSKNNTIIERNLGEKSYRILCDSDFGGGKQTLASAYMPTFEDCLDLCNTMNYFQNRADIGCTYNVVGSGQQRPGTCWCLGGRDKRVERNVGNEIAAPL
ncbi:predicted protein [Uncinocarpus reesii 1704]|uniref:Apple domain-containing protein n=1 Tax=Uncinocarpus reesii (strain UAMH 1704) TaxID=336963 RepID=C4JL13_UNCRE|nr:uncharacterized protein UREG_00228 [Uncinocarpus reesii 1704]EEP75382.1 predicted protein [Uncinocarpus reesii 1704]